ncbi:MAG: hypothetical protein ACKOAU_11280, partial [Pirellula sp.]
VWSLPADLSKIFFANASLSSLLTSVVITLRDGIEPVSADFIGGGVPRSLEYEKESFSIKTRLELF